MWQVDTEKVSTRRSSPYMGSVGGTFIAGCPHSAKKKDRVKAPVYTGR